MKSSEDVENQFKFLQNFKISQNDPSLMVNVVTHELIQRFLVRIPAKQISKQSAQYATRMSNSHPHICRLIFFHPYSQQTRANDFDKSFKDIFVYTEKLFQLKQITIQKMFNILQGFRQLVAAYGPFKISEFMITQNDRGQVKTWISQNPIKNYPDNVCISEEITVADLAVVICKKNQDLASNFIGCKTLRQVSEKINRAIRQNNTLPTYSHRPIQMNQFYKRFQFNQKPINISHYRNVFGQPSGPTKVRPQMPSKSINKIQNTPFSSKIRNQDETKPSFIRKTQNINIKNDKKIDSSNLTGKTKLNARLVQQYVPKHPSQIVNLSNTVNCNKSQKQYQNAKQINPFQSRFETSNMSKIFKNNEPEFRTAKPVYREWQSFQSNSFNFDSKNNKNESKTQKQETKRPFDITIITNNFNNYINNITHNHNQRRQNVKTQPFQANRNKNNNINSYHASQNSSNDQIKPKQKYIPNNIPNFIQKKKPSSHLIQQQINLKQKSKSNNNLIKKQFPVIINPYTSANYQQKNTHHFKQPLQKNKIIQNNQINKPSFTQNYQQFYPMTPPPSYKHQIYKPTFPKTGFYYPNQFKSIPRNKTTQFNQTKKQYVKQTPKAPNHTSTLSQMPFVPQMRPNSIQTTYKKQQSQKTTINLVSKQQQRPENQNKFGDDFKNQKKVQFKKQLRNEFKMLLGGDNDVSQVKKQQQKKQQKQQIKVVVEQVQKKQVMCVKQKIIQKKMAFAQLKKQALQVLNGF